MMTPLELVIWIGVIAIVFVFLFWAERQIVEGRKQDERERRRHHEEWLRFFDEIIIPDIDDDWY